MSQSCPVVRRRSSPAGRYAGHMEPVTHMLMGAVLARTGINRRAAYATAAMVVAAEFPDVDFVWSFLGPVTGFLHHRGITHTFLAVPFEAALLTGAVWWGHRFLKRPTQAPINWPWLYSGCLLALLSHLLLDWTNNYGVRPFFPFNPHWYAGSFVFIFEPVLFALLAGALLAPGLFGLIGSEVGARRQHFRGRGWAVAALLGVAALYGFRWVQHERALQVAAQNGPPDTTRIFASPHPIDPFTWHIVADTPASYQLSTVDTRQGLVLPAVPSDTLFKPPVALPILAAKRSYLGRVYLDWSMYPVVTQAPAGDDPNHPLTEVTFADARFLFDASFMKGRSNPPLTGTVTLDMAAPEGQRVVEMKMGDREQKSTD